MGAVRGAGLFVWLYGMVALDGGVEWMVYRRVCVCG
jgi:hypothetical protein